MNGFDDSTGVFECQNCGNVGLGDGEIQCCDEAMQPIEREGTATESPSLDELLRTVFDMSETELDVCLCVMEGGELTVAELADEIDYDRSVISRHLSHLVELSVLEKQRRLLKQGGDVYVYTPVDPDIVRERIKRLFVQWVKRAGPRLDELHRKKVEAIVGTESKAPQWKIYQSERR